MQILPRPPALNQMAQPDADRSEMCMETVLAAALQKLGINVTPEQVMQALRDQYGESGVSRGTSLDQCVWAAQHFGCSAHKVFGPASQTVADGVHRGHYVLPAIFSDAGGNPDPYHHTGHFLLGYGDAGQYMNPYGGRYVTYQNLDGLNEDQRCGVELDKFAGASQVSQHINGPYAAVVSYPDGSGYWVVAADGGVETHDGGGQHFHGSVPALGIKLNAPIIDACGMATAEGYVMLGRDGGVFCFGADGFYGSLGNLKLNAPPKSIDVMADGTGYVILAEDGGIFNFGHEQFHGSEVG